MVSLLSHWQTQPFPLNVEVNWGAEILEHGDHHGHGGYRLLSHGSSLFKIGVI